MSSTDRLSAQRAVASRPLAKPDGCEPGGLFWLAAIDGDRFSEHRRQLLRGVGASISVCEVQAAGIETHRARAEGGDLKQTTEDGDILEEVDHLVRIGEFVMECQCGR
jgi:hypothetical protein